MRPPRALGLGAIAAAALLFANACVGDDGTLEAPAAIDEQDRDATASADVVLYWYTSSNARTAPREDATDTVLPYSGAWDAAAQRFRFGTEVDWERKVTPYLDAAAGQGRHVILDLKLGTEALSASTHHAEVDRTGGPAVAELTRFVRKYDDHPAVVGWYVQDEPSLPFRKDALESVYDAGYIQGYHKTRAAYRIIKEAAWGGSRKPVYIGFAASTEIHSPTDFRDAAAYKYRFAYDRVLTHFYPFRDGTPVLDAAHIGWELRKMRRTAERLRSLAKPFYITVQAFGEAPWRLPSRAEFELLALGAFAAVPDLRGLGFYSQHQLEDSSPAGTGYDGDGRAWQQAIWDPTVDLLARLKTVLRHHTGDATAPGGMTQTFRDPSTGDHWVIAVNDTGEEATRWVEPALAGGTVPSGTFTRVEYTNRATPIVYSLAADKQRVRLTFSPFQVKVLRFVAR